MRAAKAWAAERATEGDFYPKYPHMHGGTQYASDRIKTATAIGRLTRELDMTNEMPGEVIRNLMRVVGEMMRARYKTEVLKKAVRNVEACA